MNLPPIRSILKTTLAIAGLSLLSASSAIAQSDDRPMQMLVVGDSLIWGQGLLEKDKTYTHVKQWLESQGRRVELKVKAHSGATLKLHDKEAAALKRGNLNEDMATHGEISLSFPVSLTQLKTAAEEYRTANVPLEDVKLLLITGCITDIEVANLLSPFQKSSRLPKLIESYCRDDMEDVLDEAGRLFPNITIAVVSYFPIMGPKSVSSKVFNVWLEAMSFPRPLKPVANSVVTRPFLGFIKKGAIKRSRIWITESSARLKEAVERFNAKSNSAKAVFVPTPITEDTSGETPDTLLFRLGKNGRVEDPLYDLRIERCREPYEKLNKLGGLSESKRSCELSAVGHPNPKGAKAYADSAISAISPMFRN